MRGARARPMPPGRTGRRATDGGATRAAAAVPGKMCRSRLGSAEIPHEPRLGRIDREPRRRRLLRAPRRVRERRAETPLARAECRLELLPAALRVRDERREIAAEPVE